MNTLGSAMGLVMLVGAARDDADRDQVAALRERLPEVMRGRYAADGDEAEVHEVLLDVMGGDWRPSGAWAMQLDALGVAWPPAGAVPAHLGGPSMTTRQSVPGGRVTGLGPVAQSRPSEALTCRDALPGLVSSGHRAMRVRSSVGSGPPSGARLTGEEVGALALVHTLKVLTGRALEPGDLIDAARYALAGLVTDGTLTDPEEVRMARAALLCRLWQGVGRPAGPDRFTGRAWWLAEFRALGWAHPWVRAPRPAPTFGALRLYRAAVPARREGLSWTPSLDLARWIVAREGFTGDGAQLWRADVPPERLACAMPLEVDGLPTATEYVADVAGLPLVAMQEDGVP